MYNVVEQQNNNNNNYNNFGTMPEGATQYPSMFSGGALSNFFRSLLVLIVSLFTLGLAYPLVKCWYIRWEVNHTYINSRRLNFDGKASQLYGNYIKWILLSIVTIGIYLIFFMPLNMQRWITKHTHFVGIDGESKFDGSILGLWGVRFITRLVSIITIGIGIFWATCYKQSWIERHKSIDGHYLNFNAHGIQLLGKTILWLFLTLITVGIFGIWWANKLKKWNTSHTFVNNPESLPVKPMTSEEITVTKVKENHTIRNLVIAAIVLFVGAPIVVAIIIVSVLAPRGPFNPVGIIIPAMIGSLSYLSVPILSGIAYSKAKKAEPTEKNRKYKKQAKIILIVWCCLIGSSIVMSITGGIITAIQYSNMQQTYGYLAQIFSSLLK